MTNHKAQIHGLLILISSSFLIMNVSNGWSHFTLIKYHLCMINELPTNPLNMYCDRMIGPQTSNDLRDPLVVPPRSSYNWSFYPAIWLHLGPRSYYCLAWYKDPIRLKQGKYIASFMAFLDKPWFVDGKCEGKHCIWKYNESGIYLFHIHRYEFEFMLPWNVSSDV